MPINCGAKSIYFILGILLDFLLGCNKLVQVPDPINSVTSNQVFNSDASATSAILGIYSYMSYNQSFSNYFATYLLGESADELTDEVSGFESRDNFLENHLNSLTNSSAVLADIWAPAYFDIYSANAVIAGLQSSNGVSSGTRNQLTGEAKFLRAFCYFYLTNIFGDIPLDLTTNFNQTVLLTKTPQAEVYKQIISDLTDAQNLLPGDFSVSGGMPIRANKWAATALLARVYLYQRNWNGADSAATAVINSGQFSLVALPLVPANGLPPSDSDVFAANSKESILQLQTANIYPFSTQDGQSFIPFCYSCGPNLAWMTSQLVDSFESNDLRRADWVDSSTDGVNIYYSPFKYKVIYQNAGPATENYTLLRLAEQYLIRAEAEANSAGNGLTGAVADLNVIRARAGLPPYSGLTNQQSVLSAIVHEKMVEFFAEWGHRWLDLKRWGIAISTLKAIPYKAPYINTTQLLYPIPISEIQTDPNLTQNPGYSNN